MERSLLILAESLIGIDPLKRMLVREAAVRELKRIGINSPAAVTDAALDGNTKTREGSDLQGQAIFLTKPEPCRDPVDGAEVLDEIVNLFQS